MKSVILFMYVLISYSISVTKCESEHIEYTGHLISKHRDPLTIVRPHTAFDDCDISKSKNNGVRTVEGDEDGNQSHIPHRLVEPPVYKERRILSERRFERQEVLPTTVRSTPLLDLEDKVYNTLSKSSKFRNQEQDGDASFTTTEHPTPLGENFNKKEHYDNGENIKQFQPKVDNLPHVQRKTARTKTIQIAQPALKAKTFEIHLPTIQKEFYDIEERFIIKPAGTIVVELENPIAKIPKSETILPLGHPHSSIAEAYQQNGKSHSFSSVLYSSNNDSNKKQPHTHEHQRISTTMDNSEKHKDSTKNDIDAKKNSETTAKEQYKDELYYKKRNLTRYPSLSHLINNGDLDTEYLNSKKIQSFDNNFNKDKYQLESSSRLSQHDETLQYHHSYTPKTYISNFKENGIKNTNSLPSHTLLLDDYPANHYQQHVLDDQENIKVPSYTRPYAQIRLYSNHEVGHPLDTHPQIVQDHLENIDNPEIDNNQNLNVTSKSLIKNEENFDSKRHENDLRSKSTLRNIIIYANLNEQPHQSQQDHDWKLLQNENLKNDKAIRSNNETQKNYTNLNNIAYTKANASLGMDYVQQSAEKISYHNNQTDVPLVQFRYGFENEQKSIQTNDKSTNRFNKFANYVNEYKEDREKIDIPPSLFPNIDGVPGSRIVASTPAPKDPSLTNESIQTRRIVINHPYHTIREIVEHEPYTNYHEIEIEEPAFPEIFQSDHYFQPNGTQYATQN